MKNPPDVIIVDGYVDLGVGHPGLGRHLFNAIGGMVPVIGVAKTSFHDAPHVELLRGRVATKPLFITQAGMGMDAAIKGIQQMAGPFRIPDLLKAVDKLARRPTN